MAIFKCKICGGELEIQNGSVIAECSYCGTKQTLPKLDDERVANLYDRANHFRRNNDFDKAASIFEQILNEDSTDAEAYWSLVLCHYGIEYVEDPASRRRVPTVHRAQYTSVLDDENYKRALSQASEEQRVLYEREARAINEIQKGILAISEKEEPFDVFICYKETDSRGERTHDSVLAQELYYQLREEGFKVFFSRITLEDKLGLAYEPYIFAALNSAKVMVAIGTRPEHFNAVWVKNEWSRFLSLMKQGKRKVLIPAYRDMDPYDLPVEFSHLQAQDMSKLGFMQDLTRGIKKIVQSDKKTAETAERPPVTNTAGAQDIAPLLRRAYLFLEDGEFKSAYEYAEKVLDIDPECSRAYIAKLMSELKCKQISELAKCAKPLEDFSGYRNALRFADEETAATLKKYNAAAIEGIKRGKYEKGKYFMQRGLYQQAIWQFETIPDYEDAAARIEKCLDAMAKNRKAAAKQKRTTIMAAIAVVPCILLFVFGVIPGVSYLRGDYSIYINMYNVEEFAIPNGVRSIDEDEFSFCDSLKRVTIPNSVTTIGGGAFEFCENLTYVTIGNNVTSIGDYAFYECENLERITIPASVTSIGDYAFYNCENIESITIPASVTSIGKWAFYGCRKVNRITFEGTMAEWEAIEKGAYWYPGSWEPNVYCCDGTVWN